MLYNYTQIKYSADPINSIKDILNLSSNNNLSSEILNFTKDIKIQNITFLYENKKIFEKLNLTINKNSKVAVIGDTGSGKTTLIDISWI